MGVRCALALTWITSAAVALGGCTSVRPFDPAAPEPLAPGEGLLLFVIDTELPIQMLGFSGAPAARDLPPGEHMILLAVDAGRYQWSELVFETLDGRPMRWRLLSRGAVDLLDFRVEPGRLSYVGHFRIEGEIGDRYMRWSGGLENRSAHLVERLDRQYPGLLERYAPTFGGWHRDDFLERYGALLSEPRAGEVR